MQLTRLLATRWLGRRSVVLLPAHLLLVLLVLGSSGCSLGVMAGKMLTGDPTVNSEFKAMTGVDLTKGKNKVVVICNTPNAVNDELSTLKIDLSDGITRRMKRVGIDVVNPDDVARWMDEEGGAPDEPGEVADEFEAEYVVWFDINEFSFREANSPKLLRGRTAGFVRVYHVQTVDKQPFTSMVFTREFTITYPPHQPVSEQGRSSLLFQKEYLDRVCDQLSEKFYDHLPGSQI